MPKRSVFCLVTASSLPCSSNNPCAPPILPLRWYVGKHPPQRYVPYYSIHLLSVKIDKVQGAGGGDFHVEIVD